MARVAAFLLGNTAHHIRLSYETLLYISRQPTFVFSHRKENVFSKGYLVKANQNNSSIPEQPNTFYSASGESLFMFGSNEGYDGYGSKGKSHSPCHRRKLREYLTTLFLFQCYSTKSIFHSYQVLNSRFVNDAKSLAQSKDMRHLMRVFRYQLLRRPHRQALVFNSKRLGGEKLGHIG